MSQPQQGLCEQCKEFFNECFKYCSICDKDLYDRGSCYFRHKKCKKIYDCGCEGFRGCFHICDVCRSKLFEPKLVQIMGSVEVDGKKFDKPCFYYVYEKACCTSCGVEYSGDYDDWTYHEQ